MTINDFFSGKNILILGLGRQGGGVGDANYLAKHGYSVRVSDQCTLDELGLKPNSLDSRITLSLGGHNNSDIDWADIIIKNPGVPDDSAPVIRAKGQGKVVTSSIALFVKYSPVPTIGITGTRGKTTTTMLISHILNDLYPDQIITGGNLPGTSGLDLFDQIKPDTRYCVLELSSFQLHSFHDLQVSPTYAVVTNLYPDHLNRYLNMQAYQQDKLAIVAYQKPPGFTIYNPQNPGSVEIARLSPVPQYPAQVSDIGSYSTKLKGEHNQKNIALAVTLLSHLGLEHTPIKNSLASFEGVPYRQQLIAEINGVSYINDTTATTPVATLAALAAISSPTILICGGESKKLPHDQLVQEIIKNDHVKKVIFLGSRRLPDFVDAITQSAPNKVAGQVNSMKEALTLANNLATPGDTILLSPGFASFDLFQNEFDRGRQFDQIVASLHAA